MIHADVLFIGGPNAGELWRPLKVGECPALRFRVAVRRALPAVQWRIDLSNLFNSGPLSRPEVDIFEYKLVEIASEDGAFAFYVPASIKDGDTAGVMRALVAQATGKAQRPYREK